MADQRPLTSTTPRDRLDRNLLGRHGDWQHLPPPTAGVTVARDNARVWLGDHNVYHVSSERDPAAFSIASLSIDSSNPQDLKNLTISVLASVSRASDTLKACQKYAAKLKLVDLSVTSMNTNCSTLRIKLQQIKSLICNSDSRPLEARYEDYVLLEYSNALETCYLSLRVLNKCLEDSGLLQLTTMDKHTMRDSLRAISSHQKLDMISKSMKSSARAMDVLCTAFQAESRVAAVQIMTDPETQSIFEDVCSDVASIQDSFYTAPTTKARANDGPPELQEFGFDHVLKDTALYRRAYLRTLVRSTHVENNDSQQVNHKVGIAATYGDQDITGARFPSEDIEADPGIITPRSSTPTGLETHHTIDTTPEVLNTKPSLQQRFSELRTGLRTNPTNPPLLSNSRIHHEHQLSAHTNKLRSASDPGLDMADRRSAQEQSEVEGDWERFATANSSTDSFDSLSSQDTARGTEATRIRPNPEQDVYSSPGNTKIREIDRKLATGQAPATSSRALDNLISLEKSHGLPNNNPPYIDDRSTAGSGESQRTLVDPKQPAASKPQVPAAPTATPKEPAPKTRFPTLMEVLSRQTVKPYTLFDFYIYMRDVQQSVDYLDFWLDVSQHMALSRHYVRELLRSNSARELLRSNSTRSSTSSLWNSSMLDEDLKEDSSDQLLSAFLRAHDTESYSSDDASSLDSTYSTTSDGFEYPFGRRAIEGAPRPSSLNSTSGLHTVSYYDLRASAEKILYTFLLLGSEREIVLPQSYINDIIKAIEQDQRHDPAVFDDAKDYVFQAMERDAFPQFLSLGRPILRALDKSFIFRPLALRLSRPSKYAAAPPPYGYDRVRNITRLPPDYVFAHGGDPR